MSSGQLQSEVVFDQNSVFVSTTRKGQHNTKNVFKVKRLRLTLRTRLTPNPVRSTRFVRRDWSNLINQVEKLFLNSPVCGTLIHLFLLPVFL